MTLASPTTPTTTRVSTYDRFPAIRLGAEHAILRGGAAWSSLDESARTRHAVPLIVVDCYPGVRIDELRLDIRSALPEYDVIDLEARAARPAAEIERLFERNLTDDRVFGVISHHVLEELYEPSALRDIRSAVEKRDRPTVVVGWGAALVGSNAGFGVDGGVLALADLPRWEIQQRQRAGASNWRADDAGLDALRKYKRGFFVEWRIADRHKEAIWSAVDALVDTHSGDEVRMLPRAALDAALDHATRSPFRLVPFFDPGVWGGTWMKDVCGLDESESNYAWCFDCVPEENNLLIVAGDDHVEIPAIDLVLSRPRELLGEKTFARFGAEFPIRFDFLDTMQGGNLSLQVHPTTHYIRDRFGMSYTQDESYYLLDAADDAVVYLGARDASTRASFEADLRAAEAGGASFDADAYVNAFPARKHDHFSIPAGTMHCSGRNSMVLEISATPYIFTFKMWDWDRVGLDGVPRPVHLDHAFANIDWTRDREWVEQHLLDVVEPVADGDGWREERTGLHELEFIEVRRHWFEGPVPHDTKGTVNVLNLVEGDEVEVVSPTGAFEPFVVHYAETFVVPAAVGAYVIRPTASARAERFATVKASVRGTEFETSGTKAGSTA